MIEDMTMKAITQGNKSGLFCIALYLYNSYNGESSQSFPRKDFDSI